MHVIGLLKTTHVSIPKRVKNELWNVVHELHQKHFFKRFYRCFFIFIIDCSITADDSLLLDDTDICKTVKLGYPCQLPRFSKVVRQSLEHSNVYREWDQFVREAAIFYLPDIPASDGLARTVYHNIGRTMFEEYPCIKSAGQNAWVCKNICMLFSHHSLNACHIAAIGLVSYLIRH